MIEKSHVFVVIYIFLRNLSKKRKIKTSILQKSYKKFTISIRLLLETYCRMWLEVVK